MRLSDEPEDRDERNDDETVAPRAEEDGMRHRGGPDDGERRVMEKRRFATEQRDRAREREIRDGARDEHACDEPERAHGDSRLLPRPLRLPHTDEGRGEE